MDTHDDLIEKLEHLLAMQDLDLNELTPKQYETLLLANMIINNLGD